MDEGTLLKALGRRHDANLLEIGVFVDQQGEQLALIDIISQTRQHGGARKVAHGKTHQIHIICEDGYQLVVHTKDSEVTKP